MTTETPASSPYLHEHLVGTLTAAGVRSDARPHTPVIFGADTAKTDAP
ncbi:hypothetical protein [Rhodococcus oxybenzonivorans]|nr:hypothetical protein [Rhodococcus oxybenzonivorans]